MAMGLLAGISNAQWQFSETDGFVIGGSMRWGHRLLNLRGKEFDIMPSRLFSSFNS